MSSQGLLGALDQYWSVEPKAWLHRKNTFFDDYSRVSNIEALHFSLFFIIVGMALIGACSVCYALFWFMI